MTVIDLSAIEPEVRTLERPRAGTRPVRAVPAVRSFRPDIEGLRAIAVALVVLYHAGVGFLPGGYVGVDVFFVISGFLITRHLVKELGSTGRVSFVDFYARRAKRLLPMAGLVTGAALVASWVLTSPLKTRDLAGDTLWAGLFAMNVHLARDGVDYQAGTDPSPLQHFWSLAIEEQFYVVWPLVLLIASLVWVRSSVSRARRARAEMHRVSTTSLTLVVGAAAAASFVYGVHQTQVAQSLAYFATPARGWELAIGGLVAINAEFLARRRWLQGDWLVLVGLALILGGAAYLDDESAFPGYWALLPVLGSAAVLVAGVSRAGRVERAVFAFPAVQGLGKISYGLYLWHWPMLVLAVSWFDVEALTGRQALGVVALSVWVSMVTYFVIEDPLRLLPAFRIRPGRALGLGAVITAAVVAVSLGAATWIPDATGSGAAAAALGPNTDLAKSVSAGARIVAVPANLTPGVSKAVKDEADDVIPGAAACHANVLSSLISADPADQCVFGNAASTTTVVLAGDSHAFQWLPAMEQLAKQHNWRLVSMTKAACPIYEVAVENSQLKRDYTECYAWREAVHARILKEKPTLVVTTGAIFNPRPGDFTERWIDGVGATVGRLKATGTKVAVIEDTPYPHFDVPKCLSEHLDDARQCGATLKDSLSDPDRRTGTAVAAKAAGATVINPLAWFCDKDVCPPIVGNTLIYRDNSHMTATYSRFLSGLLYKQFSLTETPA